MDITKIVNGTDLLLYFMSGATLVPMAFTKSHKIEWDMKTRDVSSKDSGSDTEVLPGRKSWKGSADGLACFDETIINFNFIQKVYEDRTAIYLYSCEVSGDDRDIKTNSTANYFGKAYISNLSLDAKEEDNATFSVSFTGSGKFTRATTLP